MLFSYEYVSQKFTEEIKNAWTVKDVVEKTANLWDEAYLIYAPTGKTFTYNESNRIANRIANSLASMGLRKGDRIGLYMANKPEYIFTLFAVGKLGLIQVPINTNFQEAEIGFMVDKAGISTIVVDNNPKFINVLAKVALQAPMLRNVVIEGIPPDIQGLPFNIFSLPEMMKSSDDSNPKVAINESDDFSIIFTSGTTGLPKGAITRHKTAVLAAKSVAGSPVHKLSRNYTCLPLFHTNAQVFSALGMRCLGASLVLADRFSPRELWQDIIKYQATFFNSIGGMLQILDSVFTKEEVPEHPAELVWVAGTPIALWERFEKKFKVDIIEGYGMTEAPVVFKNCHPDKNKRKVGSCGKPHFCDLGRQIKVVDENNNEIKVGIGELLQKGDDFVTKGYWNSPEANEEAFDKDGWFRTGDVMRVDEEGYFYFVDRTKFMIRVGGENVSAFEVEDVINSHPAVAQSAAIPVPDPYKDEEIKVYIKLSEDVAQLDFKEIIQLCAGKLAYFKIPRYLELISEFPKTPTERIQKNLLKEQEKQKENHGWDRNTEIPNWRKMYF